ncbi:MAG: hypothetical protein EA426_00365 [Spirochaetaceae bacterium]|nr:MAG: hypothetical protein EA426_00365 [Spirochaetaceae bacterium]
MPSHITHALHIEETLRSLITDPPADHTPSQFHYLGAQGPDLFLHNRRRRPSGLRYGAILHRGSIGRFIGAMHDAAEKIPSPDARNHAYDFILGFAAHAVLDRACHPFINYFAGRWDPAHPETEENRGMHSFLERLLDVDLLRVLRSTAPREYDFARRLGSERLSLDIIARIVPDALAATYRSAKGDRHLADRLENALLDSYGFYRFTNDVSRDDAARLARRPDGSIEPLRLTVVHPPFLPDGLDFANARGSRWFHPCAPETAHTESFRDVFSRAVRDGSTVLSGIIEARDTPDAAARIHEIVGDENLSDGGPPGARCGEFIADPLPLRAALEQICETLEIETP